MAEAALARFDFRVANPEQRKGTGALDRPYWVYHVYCQTDHERYACKTPQAVRRYSDFEWFRHALSEEFPWCIVPPIPPKDIAGTLEKFVGGQGTNHASLLEHRQRGLFKFLIRVGSHGQLQQAQLLQDFLEMDEAEWDRRMKAPKKHGVQAAALEALAAAQPEPSPQAKELPSSAQVWRETKHYVEQLDASIATLQERLEHLVLRRRSTSQSLEHFGVAFQTVGRLETELEGQEETPLCRAVKAVGQHTNELSTIYSEHAEQETQRVVETLMYYGGMCRAVDETIKRVDAWLKTRDGHAKAERDAMSAKEKAVARGVADKMAKAEQEHAAAQQQHQATARLVLAFEEAFREEFRRFHREKQYDMKAILKSFVDLQMDYAEKMKRSWEALLPTVEQVKL